ncbi:MAG: transcription termination/antitermination protein NusG [Gammaproteobacteria bacterium]|nr:transcription termination/antitermination protein NusG [Gammaproteobacteria bacterium]
MADSSAVRDPLVAPAAEGKRWYVVQAFSGYEKQVQRSLREHIARSPEEMQVHFGDILVPTEEVVEMKGGQKHTSERKFFPGYVLVQMQMTDQTWHLVRNVPKVSGFVGGSEKTRPMPISDREANEIIQQVSDSVDKPKMKVTFTPGELVRIIDGPFAEFNGTVEEVNSEKAKLRVSVMILGRSTPVELDFIHVAKG